MIHPPHRQFIALRGLFKGVRCFAVASAKGSDRLE